MENAAFVMVTPEKLAEIVKTAIREELANYRPPEPEPAEEELLTPVEAAEFLKCHPMTIHSWKNSGEIPYSRVGRRIFIKKSDLLSLKKGGSND